MYFFKKVILLFIVILLLTACGGQLNNQTEVPPEVEPTVEMDKVTVNLSRVTSHGPLIIADAEGFFAEQNIDVEFIDLNRTSEGLSLLLNGDLDVYAAPSTSGLYNVLAEEKNIKIVSDRGFIDPDGCTYMGIVLKTDLYDSGEVSGPADLKGQSFSSRSSGPAAYVLSKFLEQGGLTLEDLNIQEIPSVNLPDALANNSIIGSSTVEPGLTLVINSGEAKLWVSGQELIPNFQVGVMVFGERLMTEDRDLAARFLAAYLKGVQQFNQGKTERNLDLLTEYLEATREDLSEGCWPPMREDGAVSLSGIDQFLEWSYAQGELDQLLPAANFVDTSILEEALNILNK